jgi:aryl-alcohol dehydrogenase-like predicted oxidoreductase
MNYRRFGKTDFSISEISLGTWQVGGKWGSNFDWTNANNILSAAVDAGINFIDTADVYSDGDSEKALGKFLKSHQDKVFVATKCGRKLNPHVDASYTTAALRKCVEDSLKNMDIECIDLIQLHCPPNDTYYRPEIFDLFDTLIQEGKIKHLGVSVEKVEQAIKAMEYENVCSVQIIFNMFRQRPSELFFDLVRANDVGVIVRVPLASGLLSGKYSASTTFEAGDHRNFNRNGEAFDKGETFSGIDYATGLAAVEELSAYFKNRNLALVALRWILMYDDVSCVIPGASNPAQLATNLQALDEPNLTQDDFAFVNSVYEKFIKKSVHQLW